MVTRKFVALALGCLLLQGCGTVGYYSQIISGHMKIVLGKRPVSEIVNDEATDKNIRHRLQVAQSARQFAVEKLALPKNESYTSFYDTGRDYVTWNVVAAGEFSFTPKRWCFPVAGCVSYRGYYAREDAEEYAADLASEGWDSATSGATAYSTLGWFADPLLNTMLNRSDAGIAALIFHEMAHQQLYVTDDSTFNESFAGFVERAGLAIWQSQAGDPDALANHVARKQRQQDFIALLRDTREDLSKIYHSALNEEAMRLAKDQRYQQMQADYQSLKASWDDYAGYDGWFARELNNARLVAVGTYNDFVPAFEELMRQSAGDFEAFYAAAAQLGKLPRAARRTKIAELMAAAEQNISKN